MYSSQHMPAFGVLGGSIDKSPPLNCHDMKVIGNPSAENLYQTPNILQLISLNH